MKTHSSGGNSQAFKCKSGNFTITREREKSSPGAFLNPEQKSRVSLKTYFGKTA